jgi:3-keto-5-aminohexanoate cleavage enzyme
MFSETDARSVPFNQRNYLPMVINVALTGTEPTKSENPLVPFTPSEIAADAARCAEIGATVFHIHMRDASGKPTQSGELFRETIERIRAEVPEAIVCATTTSRGSANFEERCIPLTLDGPFKPDFASLSMGSFNFPKVVSRNPRDEIESLANLMKSSGVLPELEVFEPGMLGTVHHLIREGAIPPHPSVNIFLGNLGSSGATVASLAAFMAHLPVGSAWALAGIGRFQRKSIVLAAALGGNVRVGLEDDPIGNGSGTWSNMDAVRLAVDAARLAGRRVASFAEARMLLGLIK